MKIGDKITISGDAYRRGFYVLPDEFCITEEICENYQEKSIDQFGIEEHLIKKFGTSYSDNDDRWDTWLESITVVEKRYVENIYPDKKTVFFTGYKRSPVVRYHLCKDLREREGTDGGGLFGVNSKSSGPRQKLVCFKETEFSKEKYCLESQVVGLCSCDSYNSDAQDAFLYAMSSAFGHVDRSKNREALFVNSFCEKLIDIRKKEKKRLDKK